MTLFAPEYYGKFNCIADKCKNNCCIGWEIDVDKATLEFYKTKPDLIKHVEFSPTPHFRLVGNERCPFLNDCNLCEIINQYGKDGLCQICSDHPRFRNFFKSRIEIGIGMCCEAATSVILSNDFSLIKIEGEEQSEEEEKEFFNYRDEILKRQPQELIDLLPDLTLDKLYLVLKNMEKLSNDRDRIIETLKGDNRKINEVELFEKTAFKRIFDYFVFRRLHSEGIEFCVLCTYIIASLGKNIAQNARMFSSEIEYSDQNTDTLYELT